MGASEEERQLRAALARLRRAEKAVKAAREDLAAAVTVAIENKALKQAEVVRITGYTREHIRRLTTREGSDGAGDAPGA